MSRAKNILWIIAILINFFLLVMYYAGDSPKKLVGDEVRYVENALQFVETGTFESHPFWPSGYPYFLGVVGNITHALGLPFILCVQILQMLLWLASGWLFDQVVGFLVSSKRAQILSLGLFLSYPTLSAFSHYFWSETIHLFLCLSAVWVWIYKREKSFWGIVFGGLLGFASLMKLVFVPIFIALLMGHGAISLYRKKSLGFPMLALFAFGLLFVPVSSANYQKHGFFFPANSTTFNLWVGLNDEAKSDWGAEEIVGKAWIAFQASGETFAERNFLLSQNIQALLKQKGIGKIFLDQLGKQYFRLLDHRTFFTKQLPGEIKAGYPVRHTFLVKITKGWNGLIWALVLVGFVLGIGKGGMKSRNWQFFFIGLLVYSAGIFLLLHVKTRYMIPLLPILCLYAGMGWANVKDHFQQGSTISRGLFLVGIMIILFLAFGGAVAF